MARFVRVLAEERSFLIDLGETRSSFGTEPMENAGLIGALLLLSGEVCVPVWVSFLDVCSEDSWKTIINEFIL